MSVKDTLDQSLTRIPHPSDPLENPNQLILFD